MCAFRFKLGKTWLEFLPQNFQPPKCPPPVYGRPWARGSKGTHIWQLLRRIASCGGPPYLPDQGSVPANLVPDSEFSAHSQHALLLLRRRWNG